MAKHDNIPDTFMGNKTNYDLLDGFRDLGGFGKVLYALSALALGAGPIIAEMVSYNNAKDNARAAQEFATLNPHMPKGVDPLAVMKANLDATPQLYEMNPTAPQDGRHAAAIETERDQSGFLNR